MYGVQELQPNDLVVSERNLWPHYKAALSLAKQVILGNGVDLISGNTSGNAFLIRTPEIVENGIRSMLNAHFNSPVYLEKRRLSLKIAPTEMSLTPDLLFRIGDYHQRNAVHSERRITLSTGDVKYKVNRGEWDRSDLYQAIAFASAFQARSGIILTFGKPVMNSKAVLRIGEMSFSQFTWNFELNAKPEDAKLALVSDLDSYFDEILNIQAAELTKPLSL
jgi:5-methylcytosine-specific restriction endonuclease McrBC regulatory subunit McrC